MTYIRTAAPRRDVFLREFGGPVGLIRAVLAVARERHVTSDAAAVAYYGFNSLVPLLLLGFVVVTLLERFALLARLLQAATGVGAAEYEALFRRIGADAAGRSRTACWPRPSSAGARCDCSAGWPASSPRSTARGSATPSAVESATRCWRR